MLVVKKIFEEIDPSGEQGLSYDQFKEVLKNQLEVNFEEDEDE